MALYRIKKKNFLYIFAVELLGDDLPEKGWDVGMYCLETNAAKILRSNLLRGFDLQNAQQRAIVYRQTPQRVEEIFIGFIRLLPRLVQQVFLTPEGHDAETVQGGITEC